MLLAVLALVFMSLGCEVDEESGEEPLTLEDLEGVWSTGLKSDIEFNEGEVSVVPAPMYGVGGPGTSCIAIFILDGDEFFSSLSIKEGDSWALYSASSGELSLDADEEILTIDVEYTFFGGSWEEWTSEDEFEFDFELFGRSFGVFGKFFALGTACSEDLYFYHI